MLNFDLCHTHSVDVTNREKVIEIGNKVLSEVGAVTILVQNAGIMPQHLFLQHTEKEIRSTFDINVLAHFWILQAFLPKMIEQNRGHIVSFSLFNLELNLINLKIKVAVSSMAGLMGSRNLVRLLNSF